MTSFFRRWAKSMKTVEEGSRSCFSKSAYKTEELAREYKAKAEGLRPDTRLRIYKCNICKEYHLTKKPFKIFRKG